MRYPYVPGSVEAHDAAFARVVSPPPALQRYRVLAREVLQLDDRRVASCVRSLARAAEQAEMTCRVTWSLAEDGIGETVTAVVVRMYAAGLPLGFAAWHNGRTAGCVVRDAEGLHPIGVEKLLRQLRGEPEPEPAPPPPRFPCSGPCGKTVRYKMVTFTLPETELTTIVPIPYKHKCLAPEAGAEAKEGAR